MKEKCPVCGMEIEVTPQTLSREYPESQQDLIVDTYHFCSDVCKGKFDATPAQYARGVPLHAE